jgi:MSHA biogenesis protein MshN
MLKDLDDRAPDSGSAANLLMASQSNPSYVKLAGIVVLILLCNIVGLYVWFLLDENKELKAEAVKMTAEVKNASKAINSDSKLNDTGLNNNVNIAKENRSGNAIVDDNVVNVATHTSVTQKDISVEQGVSTTEPLLKTELKAELIATAKITPKIDKSSQGQLPNTAIITENKDIAVAKAKGKGVEGKIEEKLSVLERLNASSATMSVSRRQISASELVQQKLTQAEKAISRNDVAKAEKLFEDVLIIDASQVQARKKLAALWFGRQALQEASNLLSQGISLAPQDSELRKMQAKIYLSQSKTSLAYQALRPLASLEDVEYQIQLASIAQQALEHQGAIAAYKLLIKMKPNIGRWNLGLAIVYDQSSQFVLAVTQYQLAISQGDLSPDSVTFAQQRIQALGE